MSRRNSDPFREIPAVGRIVSGVFGLVFAGVGLTVLAFLWGSPWGAFGSPPLIFRVFGSFIAIAFVVAGGATFFTAIAAGKIISNLGSPQKSDPAEDGAPASSYTCPRCSAPLSDSADVSPHGDVKCAFCNCWFNVHEK